MVSTSLDFASLAVLILVRLIQKIRTGVQQNLSNINSALQTSSDIELVENFRHAEVQSTVSV